jgi:protein AroM
MTAGTTVGLVAIGQTPRDDLTREFAGLWNDAFAIVEEGALNGLGAAEIARLEPRRGESDLITRLADGRSVYVSHDRLTPYVQSAIDRVCRAGADIVIVACTGRFAELRADVPVVQPFDVLEHAVAPILPPGKTLLLVVPTEGQAGEAAERWKGRGYRPEPILVASPFADRAALRRDLDDAAKRVDGIVFDCFGFGSEFLESTPGRRGKPVFIARVLIARLLCGIFPTPALAVRT